MNLSKQLTGLALVALTGLPLLAQSSDNPIPIIPGEENYVGNLSIYTYCYLTYTAPENQLVVLEGLQSYGLTVDGISAPYTTYSLDNVPQMAFRAEAGLTYLIDGYTNANDYVRFTPVITPCDMNTGLDSSNPIIAESGLNYFPCQSSGGYWSTPDPVYVTYTTPRAGKLVISMPSYISNLYIVNADGSTTDITPSYNSDTSSYRRTMVVEEDEVLNFKFYNSSPVVAFFTVEDIIPGTSMEDGFVGVVGENIIPAAAGTYWYTTSSPSEPYDQFMTVTSDAEGTIDVYSQNGVSMYDYPYIACRKGCSASTMRYIKITKPADTAEEEKFKIAYEVYQPYDEFDTAEEIQIGEDISTPEFAGTYYYAITAPEEGAWFADITPVGDPESYDFYIYKESMSWSYEKYGKTIHYELNPGERYVIKVNCTNDQRGMTFQVALNAVKAGETKNNPLQAVLGENDIQPGVEVFYAYTPDTNNWLYLEYNGVNVPYLQASNGNYVSTYDMSENSIRWEATAGVTYIMQFSNVPEGATFNLSEEPFGEGEDSSTAFEAVVGQNILPQAAGKTWFRFDVQNTGFFIMTTNLEYTSSNTICAYINEVDLDNRIPMGTSGGWYNTEYTRIKADVVEGDVVYILVQTSAPRVDNWIDITNDPAGPGATPSTAIEVVLEDDQAAFPLPTITTGEELWYTFTTDRNGNLSIITEYSTTGTLYKDDLMSVVANIGYIDYGIGYGFQNVYIPEGKYYLKMSANSKNDQEITFTFTDPVPGQFMDTAIQIPVTGNPTNYDFVSMPMGFDSIWYSIQLGVGTFEMKCPTWWMTGSLRNSDNEYIDSILDHYGNDNYGFNSGVVDITEAGTYYLLFTTLQVDNETEGHAVFSGTALIDGVNVAAIGEDADADAEYFTLDGRRVNGQPEAGMYIVRRGVKTSKIVIR